MNENWLEKIKYYDETAPKKVRVLAYGEAGSGKTTFASTFPKPFFIDTDRGGRTLKNKKIPYLPLVRDKKIYDGLVSFLLDLKEEKKVGDYEVETLVIDGLTSLAEILLYEIMKFPSKPGRPPKNPLIEKPDWDDYSMLGSRLLMLHVLLEDLPFNVVSTGLPMLEKDEVTGGFIGKVNIIGGFRNSVAKHYDEVYFLEMINSHNEIHSVAHLRRYKYYVAKSRDGLDPEIQDPTYERLFSNES